VSRSLGLSLALGLLLVGHAAAAPAQAAGLPQSHAGACTTADPGSVTVVIDASTLGGGIHTYCATGLAAGATGMDALRAAGVSVTFAANTPGFVCRLNGVPSSGQTISLPGGGYHETCVNTPPADAYWTYWSAAAGGSWSYNPLGAGSTRVRLGGYEGWSFSVGAKNPPGVTPAAHPASSPTAPAPPVKKPAAKAPATGSPQPTAASGAKPGAARPSAAAKPVAAPATAAPTTGHATAPAATPTPTASSSPAAPTPVASTSPVPVADALSPADSAPSADSASPAATAAPAAETGMPVGTIVGIAVVAVLAAAGGMVAWIRRRRR